MVSSKAINAGFGTWQFAIDTQILLESDYYFFSLAFPILLQVQLNLKLIDDKSASDLLWHNLHSYRNSKITVLFAVQLAVLFAFLLFFSALLLSILFAIFLYFTIPMWLLNICLLMEEDTHTGPITSCSSGHFDFSERLREKIMPFAKIGNAVLCVVDQLPTLLMATLPVFAVDPATSFTEKIPNKQYYKWHPKIITLSSAHPSLEDKPVHKLRHITKTIKVCKELDTIEAKASRSI